MSTQYYNKLSNDSDIQKYYRTVLNELKTKRYRCKNLAKIEHLDDEINKLETFIKNQKL
jgi:hypothetical protein